MTKTQELHGIIGTPAGCSSIRYFAFKHQLDLWSSDFMRNFEEQLHSISARVKTPWIGQQSCGHECPRVLTQPPPRIAEEGSMAMVYTLP